MPGTIVLTASAGTFSGLKAALGGLPVTVEEHPLLSFEPPVDWAELDIALNQVARYESCALTSPRAAQALLERMRACGIVWPGTRPTLWAVGAGTLKALQYVGRPVRVPPSGRVMDESAAATLASTMLEAAARGPVLFPCGEGRREELPVILRSNGLEVHEVICYRSVLASRSQAGAVLARGTVVVVASPSVMGLLCQAGPPSSRPQLIAVGPTTAASAQAAGWPPAAVASEPSTEGIAAAILTLFAHP
jgi:uroporphyrinogen-III synthase